MHRDVGRCFGAWAALGSLALLATGCGRELSPRTDDPPPAEASRPAPPAPRIRELPDLRPATCFEDDLEGGATHVYRLVLEAGEVLHLAVEQLGVDIEVVVAAPWGEQLLRVDSPTGRQGVEHVFLLAELSGGYGIELRAFEGAAGRYRARVETLRPATPDDRRRAQAARAFSEAQRLAETPDVSPVQIADQYRAAARLWRQLGDDARRARALFHLGEHHARDPDHRAGAVAAWEQALELYRRLGDTRQQAVTLARLGGASRRRGALEQARRAYAASLELWRRLGEPGQEASQLNNLALVAKSQGRVRPALELYHQALDLWRDLGNRLDRATTLSNLGVLYSMLGEHRRALDFHHKALELLDLRQGRRQTNQRAVTLTRMGDALMALGEIEAALERYREALELRRELRDAHGEATTLSGLGWAYRIRGEPREALDAFQNALAIFRRRREPRAQSTVLNHLGSLRASLGDIALARESFEEALAAARAANHRQGEAMALLGLARLARREGELHTAQQHAEEALDVFESVRASAAGRDDLSAPYLASKLPHYDFLIDLLAERHHREPTAGYDALAFEVSERARARGLLEALGDAREEAALGVDPEGQRRLAALRDAVRVHHFERLRLLRREAPTEAIEQLDRELRDRLEALRRAEEQLLRANPRWAELATPRILTLDAVRNDLLDDDTLLLEIFLGEARGFLWAVTREGSTLHELPDRETLERAALRAHAALLESHLETGEEAARLATAELSRLLLAPVADLLAHRRLLIVAPGALQYVPFAALPDPAARPKPGEPSPPLIVDHEIVSLPSVAVLGALRRQTAQREPAPGLLAVLADPAFSAVTDSPSPPLSGPLLRPWPLRYARQEAEAILRLAGQQPTLAAFGVDASRELVESGRLSGYRLIHFATHGVLDTEHPELSALLLSHVDRRGRPVDGYLRAYEILQLDLPADLVVLSACRTALGKQIRGEGLVGLTRAFMAAGAARVAVSLWNVQDRATAELMQRFYTHLLRDHLPPSRALQEAQTSMWREARWQAPYYWAGFVLQGDWRAFVEPSRSPSGR